MAAMMPSPKRKLTFEEFQAILAEELSLPRERLTAEAHFVNDLQVDSLAMASLMLRLEDIGWQVPMERAWEIRTVGEAYQAFSEGDTPGELRASRRPV